MSKTASNTLQTIARSRRLPGLAVACLLLVLLPPLRPLAVPVYSVLGIAGLAYGVRQAIRYNRLAGTVLAGVLASAAIAYGVLVYRAEQAHHLLLGQLRKYPAVSVSRSMALLPFVSQLSVNRGVSDDNLRSVLSLDGMRGIESLYLESELLTDACLETVASLKELTYLFIDSDGISDDAILAFESRFPKCVVIPFQRDLRPEPTVTLQHDEQPIEEATMDHPVLGRLSWSSDTHDWEGICELRPGCEVKIRLSVRSDAPPTNDAEEILKAGVEMLNWARQAEAACREEMANELFEVYQDTWADSAPEGESVAKDRAEFMSRLKPNSLIRDVDGSGYFYWSDDGMFGDHWVEIRFKSDFAISEIGLAG